ncbi:zinc metalloprotease HtpX [Nocardioides sp. HDW12B]|uniref:zinc metalloprotease HtpX n=1 Tax=Nocardioides sp. HDW12B TaxID=2714939 RepID=UPI00140AD275|nr:zinc metalloprotease HtpX [Nocardioides sp. HDW12B]QIK66037.1 zinc metalloprotease HtpX [Nocardioides sp. HDW12B]
MSRTRFAPDHGLTARMTATMFLLGLLFVAVVVGAILFAGRGLGLIIGIAALGFVWWQWWNSDKLALKAMKARVVSPQEAPELHAMIDRLCTLADMPKPTVAIAYTNLPNAFATGRSPSHSAVCVTTGILDRLTLEELEGVLAHELSHVAHRDVMVMSLASTAGIITGMVLRGAQFGGLGMLGGRRDDRSGVPVWLLILLASIVVYAISFVATKMLSRYRELAADRAGAFMTGNPSALASALTKISGEIAVIPKKDLRAAEPMNALFIAPAVAGVSWKTLTSTHPSLEQRLAQLAQVATELGRPLDGGFPSGPTGPAGPPR